MTKQTKAQRLADALSSPDDRLYDYQLREAAAELRRLEANEAALLEALEALLHRDEINTCQHQNTHRGGSIWEICDDCGRRWADDKGGKPAWQDPQEWVDARALITRIEAERNET